LALVSALAINLEGDSIGGGGLDLEGGSGNMIEILVEELEDRLV